MATQSKEKLFNDIEQTLVNHGFTIVERDENRPWGGFFVIDEEQAQQFADAFFDGIDVKDLRIAGKLSPKILFVAPNKKLSWQYHHRRAEIWQVYQGEVGVITSQTDEEGELQKLNEGDVIKLEQGQRHRLVGLDEWAVLAEIWQHTDPANPSNEEDIVRVQDDFGR
ncbi:cupin domain-containing protein [Albibacterium indicum]|uniref:phosphoheptose isomerase n=1 Tax=Albibacterium indicum TaxID=2292082 RepID=UPI000E4EF8C6|nr:phosphoheptose isomerase [Pedobacter indicus]